MTFWKKYIQIIYGIFNDLRMYGMYILNQKFDLIRIWKKIQKNYHWNILTFGHLKKIHLNSLWYL